MLTNLVNLGTVFKTPQVRTLAPTVRKNGNNLCESICKLKMRQVVFYGKIIPSRRIFCGYYNGKPNTVLFKTLKCKATENITNFSTVSLS